jgi:uncharacterized protein (UPF0276 family)
MKPPVQVTTVINNFRHFDSYVEFLEKAGHPQGLPFIEFLWDAYAHLEPGFVRDALGPLGKQLAFHVMWSEFIDVDDDAFLKYLTMLRAHVEELKPLYLSEHLCSFSVGSINLVSAAEVDWESQVDRICDRVARYQDVMGRQLLVENFGSTHDGGKRQVECFAEITDRTGCGILFDVSNAVLADLNGIAPFDEWLALMRERKGVRSHVGGYSRDERLDVFEDSHAVALSKATREALARTLREVDVVSVCFERAYNLDTDEMSRDMRAVETIIAEVRGAE